MGEGTRDKLLRGARTDPNHPVLFPYLPPPRLPQGEAGKGLGGGLSGGRSPRSGASSRRIQPRSPPAPWMRPGAPCLSCSFLNHLRNNNRNNTNRIKPRRLSRSFLTGAGEIPGKSVIILLLFSFFFFSPQAEIRPRFSSPLSPRVGTKQPDLPRGKQPDPPGAFGEAPIAPSPSTGPSPEPPSFPKLVPTSRSFWGRPVPRHSPPSPGRAGAVSAASSRLTGRLRGRRRFWVQAAPPAVQSPAG